MRLGKPVTKAPLPESLINEVFLQAPERTGHSASDTMQNDKASKKPKVREKRALVEEIKNQFSYRTVDGQYNTYNREKLYGEVWEKPVIDVAVQYGVSDVMIHKICKTLNIPVPPRGYWAKIRSGGEYDKPPLLPTKGATEITGVKNFEAIPISNNSSQPLPFLSEDEQQKVLLATEQITLPDENAPLHKKLAAHNKAVKEWNKTGADRRGKQPVLLDMVANNTLPRIYRILGALFHQVEILGGSVNDDFSLMVRNEKVSIEIVEAQDKIDHILTKQEAQKILAYEDAKRRHTIAFEPHILKYDYVYNGRLRFRIRKNRFFRDKDDTKIESKLADMLIDLYKESEVIRVDREAREEEARKRKEEERKREERRKLYEKEVERTLALENAALDYEKACRIRAYVMAVETACIQNGVNDETAAWIDWATKKADWLDPTIARKDELFGVRAHEMSEEQKVLRRRYW